MKRTYDEANNLVIQARSKEDHREAFRIIWEDICKHNNIEMVEHPTFIGQYKIHNRWNGQKVVKIEDLSSLYPFSSQKLNNPYSETILSAFIESQQHNTLPEEGDYIVFTAKAGRFLLPHEALMVDGILGCGREDSDFSIDNQDVKERLRDFFTIPNLRTIHDVSQQLKMEVEKVENVQKNIKMKESEMNDIQQSLDAKKLELAKKKDELQKALTSLSLLGFDDDSTLPQIMASRGQFTVDAIESRLNYKYGAQVAGKPPKNTVLSFLCALNTTQIITLHGKPGTGKTTFVDRMATALGAKLTMISVQNNWTDSYDLLGFYNPTSKTYQSTPFLDALLDARAEWTKKERERAEGYENASSRLHIICLDEMNLSRIEYYFATFLSLMQLPIEKRKIQLLPRDALNDKETKKRLERYADFVLPPNVRFVGTLNFDETATIPSPKVVDRSFYIEFTNDGVKWAEPTNKTDHSDGFYHPFSVFNTGIYTGDALPDGCSNGTMRHQTYVRQMYKMWIEYQFGDDETFADLISKGRMPYAKRKNLWEEQMNQENEMET